MYIIYIYIIYITYIYIYIHIYIYHIYIYLYIYLPTRIKEHLKTDKKSHIYQHLSSNQNCFNCCTDDCFSILDYASTKYQLKIKEALYIKWLDPILNKQKKTLKITLCL